MSKSQYQYQYYYKRNLPHFQPKVAIIFVTYRLAFSLPTEILHQLMERRKEYDSQLEMIPDKKKSKFKEQCNKYLFFLEDKFLDNYKDSPTWLKDDELANLSLSSLLFNHKRKYLLKCCLIMPNHVHTLFSPLEKMESTFYSLAEIMHSHKSFTANESNKILGRRGQFWQHENYDHFIRNLDEYSRVAEYILNNPVNAGFVDDYRNWPHYWFGTQ